MIFYMTIRPLNINGKRLLTPKYMLSDGFPGVIHNWRCLLNGTKKDGRWLYEIEVESVEHRDVVIEGLKAWGGHLKTLSSAIDTANSLSERKDITYNGEKIFIPELKEEEIGK